MTAELLIPLAYLTVLGVFQGGWATKYHVDFIASLVVAVPVCLLGLSLAWFGVVTPGKEINVYLICACYLGSICLSRIVAEQIWPERRRIVAPTAESLRLEAMMAKVYALTSR